MGAGCDRGRAERVLASGKATEAGTRFFVGESQWTSGQLEYELAQGTWLLLSPSPQLLHDLSLKPLEFCDGYVSCNWQCTREESCACWTCHHVHQADLGLSAQQ